MKRILLAVAVASIALLTVATAAFAWQPRIEGRPRSFEAGATGGYYLWHDSGGMHLRTTDSENVESRFTGTITTDGRFENLDLQYAERDDSASNDGGSTITFDLHTFSGIDGLNVTVRGGTYIRFNLQRDGHDTSIDHIFLGAYSVHPDNNPLTIDR